MKATVYGFVNKLDDDGSQWFVKLEDAIVAAEKLAAIQKNDVEVDKFTTKDFSTLEDLVVGVMAGNDWYEAAEMVQLIKAKRQ